MLTRALVSYGCLLGVDKQESLSRTDSASAEGSISSNAPFLWVVSFENVMHHGELGVHPASYWWQSVDARQQEEDVHPNVFQLFDESHLLLILFLCIDRFTCLHV